MVRRRCYFLPGTGRCRPRCHPGQEDSGFLVFSKDGSQLTEGCVADGVAMVPVRKVAENLGYKVSWDGKTQTVILKKGETPINVQLGADRYHAGNDRTGGVSLGAASYEINGTRGSGRAVPACRRDHFVQQRLSDSRQPDADGCRRINTAQLRKVSSQNRSSRSGSFYFAHC